MQANQGKVEVQAQNDELQLNALKDATLTSSAGKVTIAAIGSPKVVRVRAPLVVSGSNQINHFIPPMNQKAPTWLAFQYLDSDMQPIPSVKYKAYFETGEIIKGTTDKNGFYEISNPPSDIIKLVMDEDPLKPKQEKLQDFLVQVKGELK